jgi:hypothetical protein
MRAPTSLVGRVVAPLLLASIGGGCGVLPTTHLGPSLAGREGAAATFSVNDETYHPTECYSGHREFFLGVDIVDPSSRTDLRVVVDPLEGPKLRFTRGEGDARERVVFTSASCRTLAVSIEPTGWLVNDVRDYSGHVEADCVSQEGLALRAGIQLTHCH